MKSIEEIYNKLCERFKELCTKLKDFQPTKKHIIIILIGIALSILLTLVISILGTILALWAIFEFFQMFIDVMRFLLTGRIE